MNVHTLTWLSSTVPGLETGSWPWVLLWQRFLDQCPQRWSVEIYHRAPVSLVWPPGMPSPLSVGPKRAFSMKEVHSRIVSITTTISDFLNRVYCIIYTTQIKGTVHPKMKLFWKCTHPLGHPKRKWVCFFIGTDLEKFSITSLAQQWILCSEWVLHKFVIKTFFTLTIASGQSISP